ncbi:DUF6438 domain-containing protein [Neolewinella lacunae]|uniref:DUF6438 domain-containing protein n=1 Tax=Neolewinella lacunae TaxID=1517758 RepID=A0A923PJZ2_9BACT|nr:DUF6438 domain-containing protein [Neolewinella lacunae]MBC6993106.1 hypothetical protein [Neolewinella lacunae]MDN3635926.1 DUF6438 domain-containing protein [Neolewinella lacunae]
MRYFFVLLLLVFLCFSCNRDLTDGSGTAGPAFAQPTPNTTAGLRAGQKTPEALAGSPEREMTETPAAASPEELPDPAEAKRMGPGRTTPVVRDRSATTAPQAGQKSNTGTAPVGGGAVVVSKIQAPQVFEVYTTPCYGNCPEYTLRLFEGGLLVLDAKKGLRQQGLHTQQLQFFQYSDLVEQFNRLAAADLAPVYPTTEIPTDIPATVLRYTDAKGKEQKIKVYVDAPEALASFLAEVTQLPKEGIWDPAKE